MSKKAKAERLPSIRKATPKVPVIGVFSPCDPRIDEASRERVQNIIAMTADSISDAVVTEDDNRVVFLDDFVPAGRAGLDFPYAMDFGPDGDSDGVPDQFFIADRHFGEIHR